MRSTNNLLDRLAVAAWRKSSRSQTSNCVEVAPLGGRHEPVAVRDSKDPGGPVLIVERQEWTSFLAGTIRGSFRQD